MVQHLFVQRFQIPSQVYASQRGERQEFRVRIRLQPSVERDICPTSDGDLDHEESSTQFGMLQPSTLVVPDHGVQAAASLFNCGSCEEDAGPMKLTTSLLQSGTRHDFTKSAIDSIPLVEDDCKVSTTYANAAYKYALVPNVKAHKEISSFPCFQPRSTSSEIQCAFGNCKV
jgi:hypothetical protein